MKRLTEDQVRERLRDRNHFNRYALDELTSDPCGYPLLLQEVGVRWVEDHYEEVEG